jgi:hypothetical protein
MLRASTRPRRVVETFITAERDAQVLAFNEILALRAKRNNKLKRGDIKEVITKYHSKKLFCVTRYNLDYRLKLYNNGVLNLMLDSNPTPRPPLLTILPTSLVGNEVISSLSMQDINHTLTNSNDLDELYDSRSIPDELHNQLPATHGGRKIGATAKAKKSKEQIINLATTSVATKYIAIKKTAKSVGKNVKQNTLNNLITETANEFGLTISTINSETVKSRIKASNPTGQALQRTSPIADIEPLILHWIIRLAEMGQKAVLLN